MEQIMHIKDELIRMVEEQISRGGMHAVDTKELGEVIDMIKDLSEACYYCEKAKETCLYNEEMEYEDYNSGRGNSFREGRMYYPGGTMYTRGGDSRGGGRTGNGGRGTTTYNGGGGTYVRGNGGRRGYSDSGMDPREIEHYINDLSDELIDMLKDIPPEDKAMFQQKISSLANKIK